MGRDIDKSRKRNVAKGHLPSRRQLLKGAAAVAGAAAGSSVIGAPVIWAQEIKDIELRHVGVSYSVVKAIGDQAAKDLGFKVTMQNLDTSAAINRFITQPNRSTSPTRRLAGQARHQARRDPGHRGQEDQGIRQHPADLHQGRARRAQDSAPRHLALRGDVHREAEFDRVCTKASPSGRPSCRRSTTPTRSATGPTWSVTK